MPDGCLIRWWSSAVGVLWSGVMWQILSAAMSPGLKLPQVASLVVDGLGQLTLYWLLVALAILDAENLCGSR